MNFSWESNFTLKQKFEMNKADFKERPNLARLSDVMTVSANREVGSKVDSLRNGQQMAETPKDAFGPA